MDCFNAGIIMVKEIEGTATDREIDLLMDHLMGCADCCRHFKLLKSFAQGGQSELCAGEAPEDFEVKVMTKIRSVSLGGTVVKTTSTKIVTKRRDG